MNTTYILGTLGAAGRPIDFAGGERFEEIDNGEFTNKADARKAAAEMARMDVLYSEDGTCDVAIAIRRGDALSLLTVATAERNRKTVRWS